MKATIEFPYSFKCVIDANKIPDIMNILGEFGMEYKQEYINGSYQAKLEPFEKFPDVEILTDDKYNTLKFISSCNTDNEK